MEGTNQPLRQRIGSFFTSLTGLLTGTAALIAAVVGILSAIGVIGAGGGGAARHQASSVRSARATDLQVIDLTVRSGRHGRALVNVNKIAPTYKTPLYAKDKPPFVDITVRNTGRLVAVIPHVAFRIRNFGFIRICQAGGGLDPTERYDVTLPPHPRIGQLVETTRKVSQVIQPNGVDRFVIRMNVPFLAMQSGT